MIQGHCIENQFRSKLLNLLYRSVAVGMIDETQVLRIGIKHSHLMLEAQHICKEGTHLSGTQYQDFHSHLLFIQYFQLLTYTLTVDGLEDYAHKLRAQSTECSL